MPLPTFTTKTDLVDIIYAADVNDLQNEVAPTAAASSHVRYSTSYTSTDNVTLTDASMPVQSINFSSNSTITLPAISTSNHPFYFLNRSTASTVAIVFSGSTLSSVLTGNAAIIFSDSTASWKVFNSAGGITASSTDTLTNKTINLTSNTLVATSLQLKTAVTDETGSGALVFGTSPTIATPTLTTPTIADFTNATHTHTSAATGGTNGLIKGQGATLTISSGSVTPTHTFHRLDTEGAGATDDLDTVVVTNMISGDVVVFTQVSSARDVTYKDGTGNLLLAGDYPATNLADTITLMYNASATAMVEISRSDNA